ncbi:DMT family transporter [Alicyclobacillus sp. SP_1]|uniref:DMT family transporter n=1 Tax=Alicyclobacillus sp. SP_1 TaxID=2942475 RepID=UPI002157F981|nr:DMT family transporter [Alicyclobacillus sp. SP_1]
MSAQTRALSPKHAALLVLGVIAVSFSAIFIKWSSAPASMIGFYRMTFSALVLLPLALRERHLWRAIHRRDLTIMLIAGIFLGLHFVFWIQSLKDTSVSSSTLITALQPVFVGAGAYFAFHERQSKREMAAAILAIAGASVVGYSDAEASSRAFLGDIDALLGAIGASLYMLAGQRSRTSMPPWTYNTTVFSVAAVVLAGDALFTHALFFDYDARNWILFALLALVPTLFGHALFNYLLKFVRASSVAMTILGEPVGAILLAYALLHETITWRDALGGALLLAGVYWFLRTRAKSSTDEGDGSVIVTTGNDEVEML